jgi:inhibitor of KinA
MVQPRFLNLGDRALTLEFGDAIDRQLVTAVAALDVRLTHEIAAGRLAGVVETVPTFRSLTVIFDPLVLSRADLQGRLMAVLGETETEAEQSPRRWCLPVCYGGEYGPDLESVAEAKELTPEKVIDLHVSQIYLVYMIGFLPGFPFMGDVVPALDMPRRTEPRVRVPAGSVAITGQQTAVYPWESPGGWQLLGRCPLTLFDAQRPEPALLAPGDRVEFQAVSANRYQELIEMGQDGPLDYSQFLIEEAKE